VRRRDHGSADEGGLLQRTIIPSPLPAPTRPAIRRVADAGRCNSRIVRTRAVIICSRRCAIVSTPAASAASAPRGCRHCALWPPQRPLPAAAPCSPQQQPGRVFHDHDRNYGCRSGSGNILFEFATGVSQVQLPAVCHSRITAGSDRRSNDALQGPAAPAACICGKQSGTTERSICFAAHSLLRGFLTKPSAPPNPEWLG
jgi:hypothetical protein